MIWYNIIYAGGFPWSCQKRRVKKKHIFPSPCGGGWSFALGSWSLRPGGFFGPFFSIGELGYNGKSHGIIYLYIYILYHIYIYHMYIYIYIHMYMGFVVIWWYEMEVMVFCQVLFPGFLFFDDFSVLIQWSIVGFESHDPVSWWPSWGPQHQMCWIPSGRR